MTAEAYQADLHRPALSLPQTYAGEAIATLKLADGGGVIETLVNGTDKDGTPACATVRPTGRRIVKR